LNAFERVVTIHGHQNAEDELGFSSELMNASRACMTKPPSRITALESSLNLLINMVANGEVHVEADRELLTKVRAKGDALEITERLDKGVNCKMGAAEAGIAVKFKNTDGNGDGRKMWGAWNETFF
jgi:hypothetical protein